MTDAADREFLRQMEQAVSNLPRLQREIFLAHRLDDLSCPEIASRTGLTLRQVERHVARALAKIVRQMDGRSLHWWERWF